MEVRVGLAEGDSAKLEFTERMWGYVCEGADSFEEGFLEGKRTGNGLEYRATISIEDFDEPKEGV
jgi:hypothetical protein